MESVGLLVVLVVILAIVFDFSNGFHDASNVVSTMIATRAMQPATALIIAAVCEFVGPLIIGTAVAKTIGKAIVDPDAITGLVILGALFGAIIWNFATWYFGIPSSSSHALVGGIVGSVIAAGNYADIKWTGFWVIAAVLVTSPIIGMAAGALIQKIFVFLTRGSTPKVNHVFKRSQLFTSIALALSHGGNDAQKSMGIITMVLVANGVQKDFTIQIWVILVCAAAMSIGTACGGWTIIKTLGSKIYKLKPIHGLSAQSASAAVILTAGILGGPVSTTHVVCSSIMGVGAAERIKAVRWFKAGEIVATWFITIPASAIIAGGTYLCMNLLKSSLG